MKHFSKIKFFGGRIFKTGLAVFITASICQLIGLPIVFAVITAIVTLEPTATDSIRKGIIRFPASIIGAAYSMSFVFFIGHNAFSYALAATFTIFTCYKLKLEVGILVATITAVAMIPITYDNYFLAFATRLGTTTIGLVVSTLVNFLILPPKFSPIISKRLKGLCSQAATILEERGNELLQPSKGRQKLALKPYQALLRDLDKVNQLCDYQLDDWKFHRHTTNEVRKFYLEQKKLQLLQQITFHLGNLLFVRKPTLHLNEEEISFYCRLIRSMSTILRDEHHAMPETHFSFIEKLDDTFRMEKEVVDDNYSKRYHHHFNGKTILAYELLSINDLLEELKELHDHNNPQHIINGQQETAD